MSRKKAYMHTDYMTLAGEYLLVRDQLLRRALEKLKRGKMRSARMLASHDNLGPTLSVLDVERRLEAGPPHDTNYGDTGEADTAWPDYDAYW